MSRSTALCALIVVALALAACDSSSAAEEDGVSGIEVRDELNVLIGVIGEPRTLIGPPDGSAWLGAYFPNPSYGASVVHLHLEQEADVEVSVQRSPATSAFHDLVASRIPEMPRGPASHVRQLRAEAPMAEGAHEVIWDGHDAAGEPVGRGYFTLMLRVDGVLYPHDLVRVASFEEWSALAGLTQ